MAPTVLLSITLLGLTLCEGLKVGLYNGEYIVNGDVKDLDERGTMTVFKNIPYASAEQFRYAVECGRGTKCPGQYYKKDRMKCLQQKGLFTDGVEDCLVLTVRTTDVKGKRPVLVWIHGGGLYKGSGEGENELLEFASDIDAVVVSINYRLGLLGFLSVKELQDEKLQTYGNYGHYDQITALRWVHNNINKFGGDPARVSVMGGSAGASSTLALIVSPLANGLFNNIIPLSHAQQWTVTNAQVSDRWESSTVVEGVGCVKSKGKDGSVVADADCLRGKKATQILAQNKKMPFRGAGYFVFPRLASEVFYSNTLQPYTDSPFFTVVDGKIIERPPVDANSVSFQRKNRIRVVLSSSANECKKNSNDIQSYGILKARLVEELTKFQNTTGKDHFSGASMSDVADEIMKVYDVQEGRKETKYYIKKYSLIVSDIRNPCSVNYLAKTLAMSPQLDVYRLYNYYSDGVSLFIHGNINGIAFKPKPSNKAEKNIQVAFRSMVKNVVHDELNASWKPYPRSTMYINENGASIRSERPQNKQCSYWEAHEMGHEYGWEN